MQSSPHIAAILLRPAFLWDYANRFRIASESGELGPKFVTTEQDNLRAYRNFYGGNGKTTGGQQQPPLPSGPAPDAKDDLDDATESLRGLKFRDMDIDEDSGPPKTNPIIPPPRPPAQTPTHPGPRPPPPPPLPSRMQTAPPKSTMYVSVPPRSKTVPPSSLEPAETSKSATPVPGKRKMDESAPVPEEKSKRPRMVHPPGLRNDEPCARCERLNLACMSRQPGKQSAHQKVITACAECARLKQRCSFKPFGDAEPDPVKVKIPKPQKTKSKRAPRVKKSASEVDTSADERDGGDTKPQPGKIRARASVDLERPETGRPLSKALQKAKEAFDKVPRSSFGEKPLSGKQVTFATPETYKNLSSAGMEGAIRVEQQEQQEREEERHQRAAQAIAPQSDHRMDDEAEQANETEQEQEGEPAEGENDLVRKTDEYHEREAVQQLASRSGPTGQGERNVLLQ